MNRQQAELQAAREVLHTLIKESPYTFKYVAGKVGESPDTLSHRLKGKRPSYQHLDTALVLNILAVLDVRLGDFYQQLEVRADALMRRKG